jgi:hypothetical protein
MQKTENPLLSQEVLTKLLAEQPLGWQHPGGSVFGFEIHQRNGHAFISAPARLPFQILRV